MHTPFAMNRLSLALRNHGFHIPVDAADGWLASDAMAAPGRCFLTFTDAAALAVYVGTSLAHVARVLEQEGFPVAPVPGHAGAATTFLSATNELPQIMRRLYELSRSLPTAPLNRFSERVRTLPTTTEAERLVVQRIGQDIFREALMDFWSGRCAVTGVDQPELLRASHVKPWAECASNEERLDPMNGLLLVAHWDAAFDNGLVTFADDGSTTFSSRMTGAARLMFSAEGAPPKLAALHPGHLHYLKHHRETVFR
jgi:putative restriction endonuclease